MSFNNMTDNWKIDSVLLTPNQFIKLEIHIEYIVINVMSILKVLNQLL